MKNNKIWYSNVTFSISPDLFYLVYTLNIIERDKNLPMCYVLFHDKRECTYKKIFGMILKTLTEEEHPFKIYHDHEKVTINAIETCLSSTKIDRCYFHI